MQKHTHTQAPRKQLGLNFIELLLVLAVGATILLIGLRQYFSFQREDDFQITKDAVAALKTSLPVFYLQNCHQPWLIKKDPQTAKAFSFEIPPSVQQPEPSKNLKYFLDSRVLPENYQAILRHPITSAYTVTFVPSVKTIDPQTGGTVVKTATHFKITAQPNTARLGEDTKILKDLANQFGATWQKQDGEQKAGYVWSSYPYQVSPKVGFAPLDIHLDWYSQQQIYQLEKYQVKGVIKPCPLD